MNTVSLAAWINEACADHNLFCAVIYWLPKALKTIQFREISKPKLIIFQFDLCLVRTFGYYSSW